MSGSDRRGGISLHARDLRLALGGNVVISLPELDVAPGQLVALAGPSGSGKSSLLYLLSGLLAAQSGLLRWGDIDLASLPEAGRDRWRRETVGFIFQDFHLFEEMSPVENVIVAARFSRFRAGALRARAVERLAALGIPARRNRTVLLSRGEKQRVAIARALIGEPPVIFADEPTASLDAQAGRQVIAILSGLARDEGRSVIVATHDPALLSVADMVVALEHGVASPQRRQEPA